MRAGLVKLESVEQMTGYVGNGVVLVGFQEKPAAAQAIRFLGLGQNVIIFEYETDSLALLHRHATNPNSFSGEQRYGCKDVRRYLGIVLNPRTDGLQNLFNVSWAVFGEHKTSDFFSLILEKYTIFMFSTLITIFNIFLKI